MRVVSGIALAIAVVVVTGSAALAADLMAPPAPAAAMTSDWTGGYIGASGTYLRVEGTGESLAEANAVFGADFQTGMFLVGGRLEVGYAHDLTFPMNSWTVTLQGRAGFVVSDNVLLYGAVGAERYLSGLTHELVGLGAEFKTADNLALDLEYRHYVDTGSPAADAVTASLLWTLK